MSPSVTYAKDGHLARITLAEPEKRNALSVAMVNDLNAALDAAASDPDTRVALLTAQGPAFCAGMDLRTVALDDPPQASAFAESLYRAYRKLLMFPAPILAAVEGPAMGGAVGLALAADILWVGAKAKFAFSETRVGVVPALVSVIARRRLAPGKLHGLAIAGIEVDAREAVRIGMAEFFSEESASGDAEQFARKLIAENSDEAMKRTKAFLQSQFAAELDRQIADAAREFNLAVATEACKRGLTAFRAKQKPDWS